MEVALYREQMRRQFQEEPRRLHLRLFVALARLADRGRTDFAQGGVAGAMAGPPHVPTGDGAIGTPAFAESEQLFWLGFVLFAVGDGPAFLYAKVVDGKHVGTAEAKNQKHFDGPGADAAHRNKTLDQLFVGELMGLLESGDNAFDRFEGQVFHGENFCAGKAGFAESGFAKLEHLLGRGRAAIAAKSFDAVEDGGGGFAGDGLVGDGFEEGFVRAMVIGEAQLEGSSVGDEFGELCVASSEMGCGDRKIEGQR